MPDHLEFRIHVQADRLRGLAHFAAKFGKDASVATALEQGAQEGCSPEDEVVLIERFYKSLVAHQALEGIAWKQWMETRVAIAKLVQTHAPRRETMDYFSAGEADVLLRNIKTCLEALEQHSSSPLRIHAVMSALSQTEALLTDYVHEQVFAGIKEADKKKNERGHEEENAILVSFLGLKWAPDTRLSLSEVRNAWAHGRALLKSNELVLHDRKTFAEIARVGLADLERLVRIGQATWTAIQFDLVLLAAHEEATTGHPIRTTPLDPYRRDRRLPEAAALEQGSDDGG